MTVLHHRNHPANPSGGPHPIRGISRVRRTEPSASLRLERGAWPGIRCAVSVQDHLGRSYQDQACYWASQVGLAGCRRHADHRLAAGGCGQPALSAYPACGSAASSRLDAGVWRRIMMEPSHRGPVSDAGIGAPANVGDSRRLSRKLGRTGSHALGVRLDGCCPSKLAGRDGIGE